MELGVEIGRILLPLVITGGIAIFVVLRMKHKYKKDTLVRKNSKGAQILLDCLIPMGLMVGLVVATLLGIFNLISPLSAIAWGPGIGMLFGYFAYETCSKKLNHSAS